MSTLRRAITFVLLASALAACEIVAETDVMVRADETARLQIEVTIDLSGLPDDATETSTEDPADSASELAAQAEQFGFDPEAVTIEDLSDPDEDLQGFRLTIDPITLPSLNRFLGDNPDLVLFESFSLTRSGEEYALDGALLSLTEITESSAVEEDAGNKRGFLAQTDAATDEFSTFEDPFADLDLEEILDVSLRLEFAGQVLEHNADEVEGQALIWRARAEEARPLSARAGVSFGGGGLDTTTLILVIAGAVILLLLIVLIVVLARRGKKPPPGAYGGPPGFGGPPGYGAPPGAGPPGYGPPPGAGPPGYGPPPGAAPPPGGGGYPPPPSWKPN